MVNRRVATSMLKKYGATASSVNGGGEAVAAVENQREDEKLDLVLMDIQMPEVKVTSLMSVVAAHFPCALPLRMLWKATVLFHGSFFCLADVVVLIDGRVGSNAPNTQLGGRELQYMST